MGVVETDADAKVCVRVALRGLGGEPAVRVLVLPVLEDAVAGVDSAVTVVFETLSCCFLEFS